MRAWCGLAALLSSVSVTGWVEAQAPAALDRLSSEALFDDGLKAMHARKFVAACPKLAASYQLDPGIGTLLYLADCYAAIGKNASAWISFREAAFAARQAGQSEREQAALQRAEALRPKLTSIRLQMAKPPEGLSVTCDDHQLNPELVGLSLPVDPGPHTFEATAPGHKPWRRTLTVPAKPGVITVTVPPLIATAEEAEPAADDSDPQATGTTTALGWIGVGLGAASLVGASAALGGGVEPWPGPVVLAGVGFVTAVGGTLLLILPGGDDHAPPEGAQTAAGRASQRGWGGGWRTAF